MCGTGLSHCIIWMCRGVLLMNVKGAMSHPMEVGTDPLGNITHINNALEAMPAQLEEAQTKLSNVEHQLETAKAEGK